MNSITPNQRPIITSHIINPNPERTIKPPKIPSRGHRAVRAIAIIIVIAILGIGGFIIIRAADISNKIFVGGKTNLYSKISGLIQGQTGSVKLQGEKDGQINVLLLGIGGPGHDGPYLSDTIILAQIRPQDNKATLIAIPRDYLVNTKQLGQRKINAVFSESFSKNQDWDEAGKSVREVVEKMSGQKIPYFAVIDFKGFEKTVDLLGGIDVTVERTFTDYTFPNQSEGYLPAVTFEEGGEHMSGERALIFARSRHAAGPEGSDFARGIRQQKIIQAVKAKVVSLNIVSDVGKINELFSVIGDHFHTNLNPGEMIHLYSLSKDFNQDQVVSLSLDPSTNIVCDEVLESNGAYVLTLCPGKTADDVKDFFNNSFTAGALVSEHAVVWLADSTITGKLYKRAESELKNAGITVYKVIYTGKQLNQSVVYGVNNKPETIEFIKENLDASPVSLPPPGIKVSKDKVDIIIILGEPETSTTNSNTTR
ncbi:MAG: LCP family protein [bacterium]|nr:LCP family protein [bacterium]